MGTAAEDQASAIFYPPDMVHWGYSDLFKLIFSSWSDKERMGRFLWAMEIEGVGCFVRFSSTDDRSISESMEWVRGLTIKDYKNDEGEVIGRTLAHSYNYDPFNKERGM